MRISLVYRSRLAIGAILACCALLVLARTDLGGSQAPASTFVLLDGSTRHTADLKGRVTLVNFWASSCVACVQEMPRFAQLYQRFQSQGYATMAVAVQYDPPTFVMRFAEKHQLPFDVAIDNTGALARAWGDVEFTPTSFLLDRQGRIVKRYVGEPDFAEMQRLIEQLLHQA